MRAVRLCMVASTLALASGQLAAQEQSAPPQNEQGARGGLSEIIVTATRRTTNLQDTPLAVTAVDAATIAQASPRDLGDVSAFVPNFNASRLTGFNAASFAIRGIGQTNIIIYFEPPVAVLIDDFVQSSVQTQLLDTFDVEQVEVLRGPQGTLFGRNTTGGAVVVKTKRPEFNRFGGQFQGSIGSFGTRELKGALNIPVIDDQLALRVIGSYSKSDGYMRNGACYGPITGFIPSKWDGVSGCGDGERVGGTDVVYGRAKLLWEPNENITALFQY